jgi:hypothetical protein
VSRPVVDYLVGATYEEAAELIHLHLHEQRAMPIFMPELRNCNMALHFRSLS